LGAWDVDGDLAPCPPSGITVWNPHADGCGGDAVCSSAPYTIRALEATQVLWLPRADFLALQPLLQEVLDAKLMFSALCQLFPGSEASLLEPLLNEFKETRYVQGDEIVKAGDPLTAISIIKDGEAGVLRSDGAIGCPRRAGEIYGTRLVQVSNERVSSLTVEATVSVTSATCSVLSITAAAIQKQLGALDKVRF
jgi:CRP-like cAMP-binding protein